MKLIDLEGVAATLHQPAGLVDDAWLAQFEEVLRLVERYLLLKLIAAQATILAGTFNGQVSAIVAEAHPDGTSATTADITLLDAAVAVGLTLIVVTADKKLSFNLESAHRPLSCCNSIHHIDDSEQDERSENPVNHFLAFFFLSCFAGCTTSLSFLTHNTDLLFNDLRFTIYSSVTGNSMR